MAFRLDPAQRSGPELIRVAHKQLRKAIAAAGDQQTAVGERIRSARVALKKARAVLALVGKRGASSHRKVDRQLRRMARGLARWRDADAVRAALDAVAQENGVHLRNMSDEIRRALAAEEKTAPATPADVQPALDQFSHDVRGLDKRLKEHCPVGDVDVASGGFRLTYRCARRAFKAVEAAKKARTFHAWRKAAKVHMHQCLVLRSAHPTLMGRWIEQLRRLGSLLGAEHDLTILRRSVRRLWRNHGLQVKPEDFEAFLQVLSRRRDELRSQALLAGEQLFADKPRKVTNQVAEWWKSAARTATRTSRQAATKRAPRHG